MARPKHAFQPAPRRPTPADEPRPHRGESAGRLAYDGLNRRIQKVVEGDPDVTYDYYYNASWQMVEVHKDSDTDPYEQFVWDARYIDAPVVRFRDGNTDGDLEDEGDDTLYYCNDANMNVTALVDASDGSVVERVAYDPYGKPKFYDGSWANPSDSSAFDNAILYCGYFFDDESGLYSVRHRPYNFALGRWLSRDPIGYSDGMSLYQYVGSGPLGATDPMGLQAGDAPTPWNPNPGEDDEPGAKTQKSSVDKLMGDLRDGKLTPEEFMMRFGKMRRAEKEEFTRKAEEEFGRRGAGDPGRISRVVPGGGAWSWWGGLKDYGNPMAEDDPSYADLAVSAAKEAGARLAAAFGRALNNAVDLAEAGKQALRLAGEAAKYSVTTNMDTAVYTGDLALWGKQCASIGVDDFGYFLEATRCLGNTTMYGITSALGSIPPDPNITTGRAEADLAILILGAVQEGQREEFEYWEGRAKRALNQLSSPRALPPLPEYKRRFSSSTKEGENGR